ncbi:MAG: transglutaminase-like domain-containing protein [Actinobacteria bacterium]|nr:transglutaminase-like domain-containing protein [Actinomycetota bacterium]
MRRAGTPAPAADRRPHRAHDRNVGRPGRLDAAGGPDVSTTSLRTPNVIAGTLYTVTVALVATIAAWPIYQNAGYVILVVCAVLVALAIAAASRAGAWPSWLVVVVTTAAVLVLGMGLAVPTDWSDPAGVLLGLRDVALGAVTGWKDLITVALPVGGYRNLLVPALVVFLVGTLVTALLSWRDSRGGAFAAVSALGMLFFGLAFGRPETSASIAVGPVVVPAPVEMLVGALSLVLTLFWLAWRAYEQRRASLRRAADSSGVRVSRRRTGSDVRRSVLAGSMVLVAIVIAAIAAPAVAAGQDRAVLRSAVGPDLAIRAAVSPLSQYRSNFTDERFATVLFRVEATDGTLPDRIRIATLSDYDGATYRVAAADSGGSAEFLRVPSRLPGVDGPTSTVHVEIEGLGGIWMPTFGALQRVSFGGPDAASLADGFYYSADLHAGVITTGGGLRNADAYTLTASVDPQRSIDQLSPPGAAPQGDVPDSVKTWITQQNAGTGGAGLATLLERLRERGYLSHALTVPEGGADWMASLGAGYTFQPSASGHSLARIDTMFRALLQREADAAGEGPAAPLVAAIGDDEQFAVAASLIAQQLGFPTRVVIGARLSGADDGVAPCVDGVCTAGNVTAWVEVLSQDGTWVAADVTPQHEVGVDTAVVRQRDPQNATDVRPKSAQEVVPPDPVQQDAENTPDPSGTPLDLTALWMGLRIAAFVVLALVLVLGPLGAVVVAKALRRRARRAAPTPSDRIVGGWDEYVDSAVDHGLRPPRSDTRSELAETYGTPQGATLAVAADRAVFASDAVAPDDAEEFWRIVEEERATLRSSLSLWRRALAAVSLSSFTRGLAPGVTRDRASITRRIERRGRRRGAR